MNFIHEGEGDENKKIRSLIKEELEEYNSRI